MAKSRAFAGGVLQDSGNNVTFQAFCTHAELLVIIRKAEDAQRCIDGYGKVCHSWMQVNANVTGLEAVAEPVYERIQRNASVAAAAALLADTVELVLNTTEFDWPRTKPFVGRETLGNLTAIVADAEEWLWATLASAGRRELWQPLEVGAEEYDRRTLRLFRAYQTIEEMVHYVDLGSASMKKLFDSVVSTRVTMAMVTVDKFKCSSVL
jgi:hypothetical protein